MIDFYLHITSHVFQAFSSCTHYTSYSLLNLVHYIVCDLAVAIQDLSSLILMQNVFKVWDLRTNWLKILFLEDLGWIQVFLKELFISYSCILFLKQYALRSFRIKMLCFSKIWFFQIFNRSNLLLDWSKLKIFQFLSIWPNFFSSCIIYV